MSKRDDLINDLFIETSAMQRAWKSYFYEVLGTEKLSPMQMAVLLYIKQHQPVYSKRIAAGLYSSKSSIAQLLDNLMEFGFITGEQDSEDRRRIHISLSPLGNQKVDAINERRKAFFTATTTPLTDQELTTMIAIQQKITRHIEQNKK